VACERVKPTLLSSTCFEHPRVHAQEDLYMQFYGISFKHPYEHKTACTSLSEDVHVDDRNMSKTL